MVTAASNIRVKDNIKGKNHFLLIYKKINTNKYRYKRINKKMKLNY